MYRVFAAILGERLQNDVETKGIIGPWQSGFRVGRRIEDCLFALSESISWAREEKQGLIASFLDIRKAYDTVDREKLWETMTENGLDMAWVEFFKELYDRSFVFAKIGKNESEMFRLTKGLRQGAPVQRHCS